MSRYITKGNTNIGYDFQKSLYYVTNTFTQNVSTELPYTTYRNTIAEIQEILTALGISDVSDSDIQALKDNMETLTEVFYTWSENGSYIASLQFNDYSEYPLVINCEKGKIYIKNSNVVYDLTVNESPSIIRVPYLCSYYRTKIGLTITATDMLYFYNMLVSYYSPTVYNEIPQIPEESEDKTLKYNNKFQLSNYDNTSPVVYEGTYGALGLTTSVVPQDVLTIDATAKSITTLNTITTSSSGYSLTENSKIKISGSSTVVDGTTYSADGTYTVTSLDIPNNTIYVEESIPVSYYTVYPTCTVETATGTIEEINRDENTITLTTQVSDNILVGNKIYVTGTTVLVPFDSVTCDGVYTVTAINNKTITVQEQLSTNFNGNTGVIHKESLIGNISKIVNSSGSVIYFTSDVSITGLTTSMYIYIHGITGVDSTTKHAISNVYTTTNSIKVASIGTTYAQTYPSLTLEVPTEETLVNTTESSLENFPTGEFMLDTFEEVQAYIATAGNEVPVPTSTVKDNFYQDVPLTKSVSTEAGVTTMQLLGFYSDIYEK